jgi:ABC-type uncharacterized transport system permease subunit
MTNVRLWIRWISFSLAVGFAIHVVQLLVLGHQPQRTLVTDVVQGTIAGAVLAYFTANLVIKAKLRAVQTTVNGWSTTLKRGEAPRASFSGPPTPRTSPPSMCRRSRCIGRRSWTARVTS